MKTYIKTLIVVILTIASFSTMAVEHFSDYTNTNYKGYATVCFSQEAVIQYYNGNDQDKYLLKKNQDCAQIDRFLTFEKLRGNAYIAEIAFYDAQGNLRRDQTAWIHAGAIEPNRQSNKGADLMRSLNTSPAPVNTVKPTQADKAKAFLEANTVRTTQQDQDNQGD